MTQPYLLWEDCHGGKMRICRAGKHWFLAYQCAGSKERKSGRESLNYPFEQKWQEEKLPSCGSAGVKATPKAAPECLADKRLCECGVCVCVPNCLQVWTNIWDLNFVLICLPLEFLKFSSTLSTQPILAPGISKTSWLYFNQKIFSLPNSNWFF